MASKPVYYTDKVIALMYHHVERQSGSLSITPRQFGSHLKALVDAHYRVIGMEEYLRFARSGDVPPNAVLLTFDDGWEDFYTYAYPLLRGFGYSASNFVIVGRMARRSKLTWDQMREMKRGGMRFFSHTYDHHRRVDDRPMLAYPLYLENEDRMETSREYEARIKADLLRAEKKLKEELGEQPRLLSFPYGAYNAQVLKVGEQIGIELFFTTRNGINGRRNKEVFRLNVGRPEIGANDLLDMMRHYRSR